MKSIQKIAEEFNVTKREIDYWTTLGLVHPHYLENLYRDYSGTEKEIKICLVLKAMGLRLTRSHADFLASIPKDMVEDFIVSHIKEERERVMKQFTAALDFAGEIAGGA